MSEQNKPLDPGVPERVPCPVCAEPIAPKARKCIHCDSYTDARRHLQVSSTVLALLVALVSVITTAIPVVDKAFRSEDSAVAVTLQSNDYGLLRFIATNVGPKPGGIGNVLLKVTGIKDREASEMKLLADDTFVDAGKSHQVLVSRDDRRVPIKRTDAATASCVITVQAVQYSGKTRDFAFRFGCLDLTQLLFFE